MKESIILFLITAGLGLATSVKGAEPDLTLAQAEPTSKDVEGSSTQPSGIWAHGVGEGFRSGVQNVSVEFGGMAGIVAFGGSESHNLALSSISYGYMLGPVHGENHWYRGNLELRAELFGGGQFYPSTAWVVGLTPHLRYDFATGTRWVPFFDLGAGVTGTDIGQPDLGGTFEFNLQANIGTHCFISKNLALTVEAGLMHLSSAGIYTPNLGVNGVKGLIGLTFFF